MNPDTWLSWYWGKEDTVEEDIPKLATFLKDSGASTVLDLGCGTGRHSIFLAKNGFKISAFDQSESAIGRARELLSAENLSAELKVWNMTVFPYPYKDSLFDAVLAVKVIHHTKLDTVRRIICEIARITKVGGYVYVQVPTEEKGKRLTVEENLKSEEIEPGTFLFLEGDEAGVIHHYFSKEELVSLFGGFDVKDLHVLNEHFCLTGKKR